MIKAEISTHLKDFLDTLQALTGVKSETIFTVCTTLFVLSAGIVVNFIINVLREHRERKNYKKTINMLLANLSDVCRRQYQLTYKDIELFSLLDNKKMALKVHVYSPLQFLNKMDYSLFIKYYVRGYKKKLVKLRAKAATKTFQIIGFCNHLETSHENSFNFFMEQMKPMQEMYVKNQLILERFGKNLTSLEVSDYDFKDQLITIYNQWRQKNINNNFRNSFTNLISPLIRLLEKFQMEKACDELSPLVHECHFAYSEIAHYDAIIRDYLKAFAFENKRMFKQLLVILNIFGNKVINK